VVTRAGIHTANGEKLDVRVRSGQTGAKFWWRASAEITSLGISGAVTVLKTSKSKNDPTARGPVQQAKSFEGKKIKPVLYVGTAVGHGRYIAAQDESGKMILDRGGKPVPYRLI
jgi:hypothetical protein